MIHGSDRGGLDLTTGNPDRRQGRRPLDVVAGLVVFAVLSACSGGDSTAPPIASVASITIAPDSTNVQLGASVQLNATVRDAQGATLSGRSVTWTTSNGGVASVSAAGLVTALAQGRAVITATAESRSGTAIVHVTLPFDTLPGAAGAPAVAAVTLQEAVSRPEDYSMDHPELGSLPVSFNTVVVSITADATVGQVNTLLRQIGARIAGGVPGVAGTAAAVLVLRLPTRSHAELNAVLTTLDASPVIRAAAPDAILQPLFVPGSGASTPADWVWNGPTDPDGNHGLEITRAPQMWNLNGLVRRSGVRTETGILDSGFASHEDLVYKAASTPLPPLADPLHGMHVAGTVGATFDNVVGVDGMNPFADLVVHGFAAVGDLVTGTAQLIATRPAVRVVNLSLGYNWNDMGVTIATNTLARILVLSQGRAFYDILAASAASGRALPVIVAATANDGQSAAQTPYYSPFLNAALIHGAAPVIAVEAVDWAANRASFSNLGGHVSAPGVGITSTFPGNAYGALAGTSMAAPHVTGLVSYLYSLDPALPPPDMLSNPIRDLLIANARPAGGGAAPMIDAFATALDVDRVRGGDRVLRGLLDVNDGTADGNKRVDEDGIDNLDDFDFNGQNADGVIDISDFRRWRDWLLQAEDPTDLRLDGAPDHLKKDLNGDRRVQTPDLENVYPRGDFNGDGMISRSDAAPVPGVLDNQQVTDLDVLQQLFSDPDYASTTLPELIDSGDIEVDAERCISFGPKRMLSTMKEIDTQLARRLHTHPDTAPRFIHTIPVHPAGYTAMLEFYDQADTVVWTQEQDTTLAPGEDIFVECNLLYFNDFLAAIGDEWSKPIAATTPNGRRFLGQFGNESLTLTLDSLPAHDELELVFDVYIIDSWNGNGGVGSSSAPDIVTVSIDGVSTPLLRTTFSNKPRDRQAYPDEHPGGSNPAGAGALAINALGYPPGSDFFGDTLYQIRIGFTHSDDSIVLRFESQQTSGSNEQWGIDNVFVTRIR
ncbi:MAG: S8 family serine peptidase [Gemmatimonadetes bacterium]|nr:S8 family serine peptidase [Gemmatimonadota bacterium]